MRIRDGFVVRDVAGAAVALPIGERVIDFNGLLSLNSTGRVLWERLAVGCSESDLVESLTAGYRVTPEDAQQDVRAFIAVLREKKLITED